MTVYIMNAPHARNESGERRNERMSLVSAVVLRVLLVLVLVNHRQQRVHVAYFRAVDCQIDDDDDVVGLSEQSSDKLG